MERSCRARQLQRHQKSDAMRTPAPDCSAVEEGGLPAPIRQRHWSKHLEGLIDVRVPPKRTPPNIVSLPTFKKEPMIFSNSCSAHGDAVFGDPASGPWRARRVHAPFRDIADRGTAPLAMGLDADSSPPTVRSQAATATRYASFSI